MVLTSKESRGIDDGVDDRAVNSFQRIRTALKRLLVHAPWPYSSRLDTALHLPLMAAWVREHRPFPESETREQLYGQIAHGLGPITFLEFGVHRGASMRRWLALNSHPESRFVGFDSFEGLPEDWTLGGNTLGKGHFSTNGALPDITDPRVRFVKGWFQDTLPAFLQRAGALPNLVVHCDADLYSSTTCALGHLHRYLIPGTIIVFDDFSSILDDFRALNDYTQAYGRRHTVLGAAHGRSYFKHVAIRIDG